MRWFGHALQIALSVAVLVGYGYLLHAAVEPFEVSSDTRIAPAGAPSVGRTARRTGPSVFWFTGFGGK